MSGEPGFSAVDTAGSSMEGPRKRLVHDVDRFLLEHMFVTTERHPSRLWRVKKGSGMGTKNPGELSDAAFAKLVENSVSLEVWSDDAKTTKSEWRQFSEVTVKFLEVRVWKGGPKIVAPPEFKTNESVATSRIHQ